MKNWRRVFLGTISSALVALPVVAVSAETSQQTGRQSQGSTMGDSGQRSGMDQGQKGQQKGKSATGEPAAGGPEGEDKAGGSGPSGPQAMPPGKAPQFEGGKKTK